MHLDLEPGRVVLDQQVIELLTRPEKANSGRSRHLIDHVLLISLGFYLQ